MSGKVYYGRGEVECIDAIRSALTTEEFRGFCKGNVIKYAWRERFKGGNGDLEKARDYIGYAVAGTDVHDPNLPVFNKAGVATWYRGCGEPKPDEAGRGEADAYVDRDGSKVTLHVKGGDGEGGIQPD